VGYQCRLLPAESVTLRLAWDASHLWSKILALLPDFRREDAQG